MSISIDQLAAEVNRQLAVFQNATDEIVKDATVKIAKNTVQELKATSPKASGAYASSWRRDKIKSGRHSYAEVIHAGDGEYRLTHLLEKPHKAVYWGRPSGTLSKAQPHIAPAEEKAIADFETEIRRQVEAISK